ncbi:MAG: diversity-generating retroelement protein Avd [Candidatus Omnitrophica bacterium]|nr:diversity-generating retroelement protein Avd [Candidatus Omnitrophota bacterium]
MARYEHLPIFQKAYDLQIRIQRYVDRMSKLYRYSHGEYLIKLGLDFLYLVVEANSARNKYQFLVKADRQLEKIRIHCRLLRDLKSFTNHQYEVLAREIDEIGKQLGGWLKKERT